MLARSPYSFACNTPRRARATPPSLPSRLVCTHAYRLEGASLQPGEAPSASDYYAEIKDKLSAPLSSYGYVATEAYKPLSLYKLLQDEPLGANEVDIAVTHNGVCHSDLHMKDNEWAASKYPFVPGHEVVGTLADKGDQVQHLVMGERLGVAWMRNSCRRCYACLRGQENVCVKGYKGTILGGNFGGFQSIIRVPADFAYKIPDEMSSTTAAPLLCAGITVYAPLARFMAPGMRVGVLGVGGLGHLAIQFADKMGGYVVALDRGREKQAEVMKLGARALVDTTDAADVAKYAGDSGLDVIINCASANVDTGALIGMLRNDGTLIQVGIPGGGQMTLPVQDVVFGQKKVAGSIVGGRADMDAMLKVAAVHGIKPMVQTMPLSKVNEAIEKLKRGEAHYRIVLTLEDEAAQKA